MEKIQLKYYSISISERFSDTNFFNMPAAAEQYSKIVVLADKNTEQYCLPVIEPFLPNFSKIIIEPGEKHKHIETCNTIWQQFVEHGITRQSLLINLGGGVIGDMGGFTAGTYKRGFDFINIPTTLLAQVDASVGGKTGIDLNGMKNMIGLFNNPKHIFIAVEFLKTLPLAQLRSGFAEVMKHGLICNSEYWNAIKSIEVSPFVEWLPVIKQSVEIKKLIVEADPFESGLRKILNFGHTIGHAIETMALNKLEHPLLHGEAIAIGMICEAWLSNQINGLSDDELNDIVQHLLKHFPKTDISAFDFDRLLQFMKIDKKNMNDDIQFSLLKSIGDCSFNIQTSDALIQQSIKFYLNL